MADAPIRIVLADDHRMFREGLAGLLRAEEEFDLVAEAGNGREALRLAEELKPDVLVLDVTMPELNGVDTARAVREAVPDTAILALSMHAEGRFVTEMFQAGAEGYVLKMSDFDELADAVRTVAAGGRFVSPRVGGDVVSLLVENSGAAVGTPGGLSSREREILHLLAEGKSAKESASILHVSVKTVDSHRRQIMAKLGLNSVAELTKYAIRSGLTSL
ncbi:MAG: response regulator transcription factor [Planctomycetes bacterium]|nr:response regulator transcription factor [Planctomycetota bacterium]